MIDYLKSHMGTIVLSTAILLVGLVLGLICKQNGSGIYISANYPGGEPIFVIGNSKTNVSDIEISSLSLPDSLILASKISTLDVKQKLSLELRDMAKKSKGPFAAIPVVITLHFTNENEIAGPVAKACRNTPIYGNALVAYAATGSQNSIIKVDNIMGLNASREKLSAACNSTESGVYDVWLSKKHVEEWLERPIAAQDENMSVKANIIISGLNI
jgi:hypothetical protein